MDLVKDYGTTVPDWYAGQCPLIDGDVAILAPGGKPLMMAVELATGKTRWQTENPGGWDMTHSSIAAIDFPAGRQYVYCASRGVVGVSAKTGEVLWTKPDWRVPSANMPTPVVVGSDRLFLSGGYEAGCVMVRLKASGQKIETEEVFRLDHTVFDSPQQTPILYKNHIYSVITQGKEDSRSQLACLDLTGKRLWVSGGGARFGLGAYMLADGLLLVLNGRRGPLHGTLRLVEATPRGYNELARAKVLEQHEAWGPMAMAGDRLIVRDLTQMVCLKLPMKNEK
jgi:outer membrane protein assembly factor BamB